MLWEEQYFSQSYAISVWKESKGIVNRGDTFSKLSSNVFNFHTWQAQLKAVVLSSSLLPRSSGSSNVSLMYQACCREKIGYLLTGMTSDSYFTIAFLSWLNLFELWGNKLALEWMYSSERQSWQQKVSPPPHLASRLCCWFPGSCVVLSGGREKIKGTHSSYVPSWAISCCSPAGGT